MSSKILVLHGASRLAEMLTMQLQDNYIRVYKLVDPSFSDERASNAFDCISRIEEIREECTPPIFDYVSTIGYKNMKYRMRAYLNSISNKLLQPVNVIHPAAYVSASASLGVGNILFPGVVVEDGVTLGDNNIIWSNACICHDAKIGSHNFIAASVTIGGLSIINDSTFMGFGSIINEKLELASDSFLASGTVLTRSILQPGWRMCGIPARKMS
ncbi:hypothetical protein [Prochlorococcus marinus]|uniref:hypothetical protein n=1 Tax=Prochlorococcus marinus TaxID=1219 RepID=UPI0018C87590|nr:hypothetical protein [Prochlorococcus marinus]